VDVSDPVHPKQVGSYHLAAGAKDVQIADGLVFVATEQGGLHILGHIPTAGAPLNRVTAGGGSVVSDDGRVVVHVPPYAVPRPVLVEATTLPAPSQQLISWRALHSFTLEARDESSGEVTLFRQPYTLVISYTDAEVAAQGLREEELQLVFWNGSAWVEAIPCEGCGLDTTTNRIIVRLDRLTEFAVVAPWVEQVERTVFLPLMRR
jgi:hypothetical protein